MYDHHMRGRQSFIGENARLIWLRDGNLFQEVPWKYPGKRTAISLRPALRPRYIQGRSRPIEWLEFVDSRVRQTEGTLSLSICLLLTYVRPFAISLVTRSLSRWPSV